MSFTNNPSFNPTVAATPTGVQSATALLATMAALNGQATDYNPGSQVRTEAEAIGAALEQQGISAQALALQSLIYGAMALFGVSQAAAVPASGMLLFSTSNTYADGPNVPQAVAIPSGTLATTPGGIIFALTAATVMASGTNAVTGVGIAVMPGASGNIAASGIGGLPITSLGWPLFVTNPNAMTGGANAGNQSTSIAQLASVISSLGLASPVAAANAPIGVSGVAGEYVQFADNYEPWIAAGSGPGSGTAGFTVFVDNGSGYASPTLLTNVQAWLTGNAAQNQSGFRPNGVPFTVSGVTPVYANVSVTGTVIPGTLLAANVQNMVTSGITNYFAALPFSPYAAQQPQIAGTAADAGLGAFQSLAVNLYYSTAPSTPVSVVSGVAGTRVILSGLSVSVAVGT